MTLEAAAQTFLSPQFRAVLIALGELLRFDITMLECRNAQIRRCCISRTWKARFPEVSSRFLLQMYRTSVREGFPHEPEQKRRPRGNAQGIKSMKKAAKEQARSAKRKQAEAKRPKGGKSGKPRRRFRTEQGRQRNIGTEMAR